MFSPPTRIRPTAPAPATSTGPCSLARYPATVCACVSLVCDQWIERIDGQLDVGEDEPFVERLHDDVGAQLQGHPVVAEGLGESVVEEPLEARTLDRDQVDERRDRIDIAAFELALELLEELLQDKRVRLLGETPDVVEHFHLISAERRMRASSLSLR